MTNMYMIINYDTNKQVPIWYIQYYVKIKKL